MKALNIVSIRPKSPPKLKGITWSAILTSAFISLTVTCNGRAMSQGDKTRELSLAIEGLYSRSDLERAAAKKEILKLGTMSIEPLCSFLTDLLKNPYPRFPKGEQEDAARALALYSKLIAQNISPADFENRIELARKYFINSRLIDDAIDLLGELRAEKAAPILIKIMEARNLFAGPDGFGGEMVALSRIGTRAVPYLIAAIKDARQTARRQEDVNLGFVIDYDEGSGSGEQEDRARIVTLEETKEEAAEIEIRFYKIQMRGIMVLGEICNESALSFLKKFKGETEDKRLIKEVESILRRTENRRDEANAIKLKRF